METRTGLVVVTLALAAVVLGAVVAPATGTTSPGDQLSDSHSVVEQCAADPPADFDDPDGTTAEVVGWVEGYWYDEPLNITATDGLTESELGRLSARTAARVEALRCLTVQDGLPPVEIVTREAFADNQQSRQVGETERLVDNAKFETTLTIGSETDSVDVRQSDTSNRVGGFYDFVSEEIVIVSDDPSSLTIDESVLAEELGHAIQDQQFDLSSYDRPTVDRDKGILGLIEGDIGFVVDRYLEACDTGGWTEPCVTDQGSTGGGGGADIANWALYFEQIQPYSDGPSFVQTIKAQGGWTAVDDLYADPPVTALHTVYPETYGVVEPRDIEVPDRSTDDWQRVTLAGVTATGERLTHDTLGVSTIAGMFAAPGSERETEGSVLQARSMYNLDSDGQIDQFNPHEYAHPVTEGWRGDSLYTYVGEGGESATLWELAWNSTEDVETFVDSYEQLAEIRGGEPVAGYEHTFRFDEDSAYDMALTLVPDGDRVTVVTAPTVEQLTAVDQALDLPAGSADGGSTDDSGSGGTGDGTGGYGGSGDTGAGGSTDGDTSEAVDGPEQSDETAGDSETSPLVLLLPVMATSLLVVLALLSIGTRQGRGR
jgi:hypothetical protein